MLSSQIEEGKNAKVLENINIVSHLRWHTVTVRDWWRWLSFSFAAEGVKSNIEDGKLLIGNCDLIAHGGTRFDELDRRWVDAESLASFVLWTVAENVTHVRRTFAATNFCPHHT